MKLVVLTKAKYTRKYWKGGRWHYVYPKGMGGDRARAALEAKEYKTYGAQRAKLYTKENRKHDFSDLSDRNLLKEYIETGNDLERFNTMANTEKRKLLMTFAVTRGESIFREMDSRGLGATDADNLLREKERGE